MSYSFYCFVQNGTIVGHIISVASYTLVILQIIKFLLFRKKRGTTSGHMTASTV
jgi:hypothetical protein